MKKSSITENNGIIEEDEDRLRQLSALSQVDVERLPARIVTPNERRPRWCSRNLVPMSPNQLIDGRVIRSALLINRFRKKRRKIKFSDDVVSGILEPENPWRCSESLNTECILLKILGSN